MIAFYLRLSVSDGDLGKDKKDESNSIESQRLLLSNFLKMREDIVGDVREYVDDGYTGSNFNRPAFKQMIEDVKSGEITIIMVKDLSRLGRDYIGVGDYMEQVFPILGVRFIAVNSNYDSNDYIGKTMGLETSMMNLVNSFYCKDASKKLRSSLQTKWKQGITTSGRAPYGYFRDKEAKGGLRIDEEAAKHVRFIFEKAAQGFGSSAIANMLNENNVPTPGQYRKLQNLKELGIRKVTDEEWLWDVAKVLTVLNNLTYTGSMVHGKTAPIHAGSKSRRNVPKSKWYVVENTHEAIVTMEEYEAAQAKLTKNHSETGMRQDLGFSLKSKVYCGNCRLALAYEYGIEPTLVCAHAVSAGSKSKCNRKRYKAGSIESIVLFNLKQQVAIIQNLIPKVQAAQEKNEIMLNGDISKLADKIAVLKAEGVRQYEAYAEGVIDRNIYIKKKNELAEKIVSSEKKKKDLEDILYRGSNVLEQAEKCRAAAVGLDGAKTMNRKLAEAFVDKVYIHNEKQIEISFVFEDVMEQLLNFLEEEQMAHEA